MCMPSVRFQGEGLRRRCSDRSFNHDVRLFEEFPLSLSLCLFLCTAVPFIHSRRIIAGTSRVLTLARLSLEIAATPTPLSRVHGSGTINNARGGHYLSLTLRIPAFTTEGERVCGYRRPARLDSLQRDPFSARLNFSNDANERLFHAKLSQMIHRSIFNVLISMLRVYII